MARSKRQSPAMGMTMARSEKEDKQLGSRRVRHINKVGLQIDGEDHESVDRRAVDNVYFHAKDGKRYYTPKTIALHPELMRK